MAVNILKKQSKFGPIFERFMVLYPLLIEIIVENYYIKVLLHEL